ncbi:hypothetical protein E2562_025345 [Oryza meyeriana var. granulata]|uniref:NAC domain-containing protein n=1 Tax=Oryza meyeriana var. granulata TaxID=110450 RepID=A0A6G1DN59_9ORYZ|nr:hypothetical protein E2562_025345 [Oryza meyeriana var. granulata]
MAAAAGADGLPPGLRFDPSDDELPWKLLADNGRGDEAFFFVDAQAKKGRGKRQKRTVAGGGFWQGQRMCVDGHKLYIPGDGDGGGLETVCRKYVLSFFTDGERGSSGWVMHEYAVTAPADLASSPLRLYRIRFTRTTMENAPRPDEPWQRPLCSRSAGLRRTEEVDASGGAETALFDRPPPHPAPTAAVDCSEGADQNSSGVMGDDSSLLLPGLREFDMPHLFVPQAEEASASGGAAPAPSSLSSDNQKYSSSGVMDGEGPALSDFEFPESIDEVLSCIDLTTGDTNCFDFSMDELFDLAD